MLSTLANIAHICCWDRNGEEGQSRAQELRAEPGCASSSKRSAICSRDKTTGESHWNPPTLHPWVDGREKKHVWLQRIHELWGHWGGGNFWGETNVYSVLLFKAHPSVHTGQPRLPTRLGRETVLPKDLLGNNGRKYGLGERHGWGGCGERMWAGRCWGSGCEKLHTAAGPSFLPPRSAVSTTSRQIVGAVSRPSPSRELPGQLN